MKYYIYSYYAKLNNNKSFELSNNYFVKSKTKNGMTNEKWLFNDFDSLYEFAEKPLEGVGVWAGNRPKGKVVEFVYKNNKNIVCKRITKNNCEALFPVVIWRSISIQ